jgi:hypothetical protein
MNEIAVKIRAADDIDFGPFAVEHPTLLDKVRKAISVIVVHMRGEDGVELHRIDLEL